LPRLTSIRSAKQVGNRGPPGARSQEPGARSQEPGARSQEPGVQEFRSSGVQEVRRSGGQEFGSLGFLGSRTMGDGLEGEFGSGAGKVYLGSWLLAFWKLKKSLRLEIVVRLVIVIVLVFPSLSVGHDQSSSTITIPSTVEDSGNSSFCFRAGRLAVVYAL
jgi:hypothetical protein